MDGWYQFGEALRKRFRPTEEDKLEAEIKRAALARYQAESQYLDKPIYEQQDPWNIGPQEVGGKTYQPYKSPITGRMIRELNIGVENLPETERRGLGGLKMDVRGGYKPSYQTYINEEGQVIDIERGKSVPPGFFPVGVDPYIYTSLKDEEGTPPGPNLFQRLLGIGGTKGRPAETPAPQPQMNLENLGLPSLNPAEDLKKTIGRGKPDQYGFTIGEQQQGYEYIGNNQWRRIKQ